MAKKGIEKEDLIIGAAFVALIAGAKYLLDTVTKVDKPQKEKKKEV